MIVYSVAVIVIIFCYYITLFNICIYLQHES